jgi:hypothetical protein
MPFLIKSSILIVIDLELGFMVVAERAGMSHITPSGGFT